MNFVEPPLRGFGVVGGCDEEGSTANFNFLLRLLVEGGPGAVTVLSGLGSRPEGALRLRGFDGC